MESTIQYALLCGTVLLCYITAVSGQCEPPDCYINEAGEPTSCHTCGIGWGVVVRGPKFDFQVCRSSPEPRNTECEPCIAGVNYSDVDDGLSKCQKCVPCVETQEVKEECTVAKNTVCQCKSGMAYYDGEVGTCTFCRECSEREVEISPCNHTHDRQCTPVFPPPTEVTTTEADNTTTPSSTPTSDIPTPNVAPSETDDKDNTGTILTIICGCAGGAIIVVAIAVLYCVVMKRINCSGQERCTACSLAFCVCNCGGRNNEVVVNGQLPMRQVSTISSQTQSPTTLIPNGNHHEQDPFIPRNGVAGNGWANGLANGGPNGVPVNNAGHLGMAVNQNGALPTAPEPEEVFPAIIRTDLIEVLNAADPAQRDWRMIAQDKLQVTYQEYTVWQQSNPAARLLRRWESEGRSLEEFMDLLRDMGRDDILEDIIIKAAFSPRMCSDLTSKLTAEGVDQRDWIRIAQDYLREANQECQVWKPSNPGEHYLRRWEVEGKSREDFLDKLRTMHRGHQHLNGNVVV